MKIFGLLAVAPLLIAAAPPPPLQGFTVTVSLSAKAKARLAKLGESITVSTWYSADARPRTPQAMRDETTDELMLGEEVVRLGAAGGIARFTAKPVRRERLRFAAGPVMVNVNIYTARTKHPDNLLNCQPLVADQLAKIGIARIVTCKLIYGDN